MMQLRTIGILAALLSLTACGFDPKQETVMAVTGSETMDGSSVDGSSVSETEMAASGSIIPGSERDFIYNIGDRVYFGYDKHSLTEDEQLTLDSQALWLKTYPNTTILIEGHADERGTREYNLALGDRRANTIKVYLTASGIAESRIATISYGKERPSVLGHNENAWTRNRRGVTRVVSQ